MPTPINLITEEEGTTTRLWRTCKKCGLGCRVEILKTIHPNNYQFCNNCVEKYANEVATCNGGCRQLYEKRNLTEVKRNYAFQGRLLACDRCIAEYYFVCFHCEKLHRKSSSSIYNGNYVCRSCYSENYYTCHGCNNVIENEHRVNCNYCESSYCEECIDVHRCREMDEQEYRKPAKTLFTGRKNKDFYTRRHVGVEIEVEDGIKIGLKNSLPGVVGLCKDGSLENGIEIQTPPASCSELKKILLHSIDTLSDKEYRVSKRCGLHIHLNAEDIRRNGKKISRLAKTYWVIEPILYAMIAKSRKHSRFCIPLYKKYKFNELNAKNLESMETKWYRNSNKRTKETYKRDKYHSTRYRGVNLHSVFFRGSLELRHHQGTLSYQKMRHWINFNSLIMEFACNNHRLRALRGMANDFDHTNYEKIKDFFRMIETPEELQNYIYRRIDKFYPYFLKHKNLFVIYYPQVEQKPRARINNLQKLIEVRLKSLGI